MCRELTRVLPPSAFCVAKSFAETGYDGTGKYTLRDGLTAWVIMHVTANSA